MARMFPQDGPNFTQSRRAEPYLYSRLSCLSDEFTVIHSIPWLAGAAKTLDPRAAVTGEIDFLLLHPNYGILAIEVKGGRVQTLNGKFAYVRSGASKPEYIDPVGQVRRGTHGLAAWLGARKGMYLRIGYAIAFPDAEMPPDHLPPSLVDPTGGLPQKIILDYSDLRSNLEVNIIDIMEYWQEHLHTTAPSQDEIDAIVDLICPTATYGVSWTARIDDDTRTWLRLTEEQVQALDHLNREERCIIEGRPGTGKTLLLVTFARYLSDQNQTPLILVYNRGLAAFLQNELKDSRAVVFSFHDLCREAERKLGSFQPGQVDPDWYHHGGPLALYEAIIEKLFPQYDALLVDEAQVFREHWWRIFLAWFSEQRIVAFCDEAQVFTFEKGILLRQLMSLMECESSYLLSINLRSPRKIFERLHMARPTAYQHTSARPPADDTLQEIVTLAPMQALYDLMEELRAEGLHPRHVTLLYAKDPPSFEKGLREFRDIGTMERISRFRGLESSVIIIWAIGPLSEVDLFCAFSRATSRCIVIYDQIAFINKKYGVFGEAYLNNSHIPDSIRNRLTYPWDYLAFDLLQIEVRKVVSHSGTAWWCSTWKSWIIHATGEHDLAATLWRQHLCMTGHYGVHVWNPEYPLKFVYYSGVDTFNDYIQSRHIRLAYCVDCEGYTRHMDNKLINVCVEHDLDGWEQFSRKRISIPDHTIEHIQVLDTFIIHHAEYDDTQKKAIRQQLSLFLFVLILSQQIDHIYHVVLAKIGTSHVAFMGAMFAAGCDLLRAREGAVLDTTERSLTWERWCPHIKQALDHKSWRTLLARGFGYWIGWYEWAEKEKKHISGRYRRANELRTKSAKELREDEREENGKES